MPRTANQLEQTAFQSGPHAALIVDATLAVIVVNDRARAWPQGIGDPRGADADRLRRPSSREASTPLRADGSSSAREDAGYSAGTRPAGPLRRWISAGSIERVAAAISGWGPGSQHDEDSEKPRAATSPDSAGATSDKVHRFEDPGGFEVVLTRLPASTLATPRGGGALEDSDPARWLITLEHPALASSAPKTTSPGFDHVQLFHDLARDMGRHLTNRIQALHLAAETTNPNAEPSARDDVLTNVRRSLEAGEALLAMYRTFFADARKTKADSVASGEGQLSRPRPTNLAAVLRRMEPLFRQIAGSRISLECDIAANEALVDGEEADITRLVCSLVISTINELRARSGGRGRLRLGLGVTRDSVELAIEDNCPQCDPTTAHVEWPTHADRRLAARYQIVLATRSSPSLRTTHVRLRPVVARPAMDEPVAAGSSPPRPGSQRGAELTEDAPVIVHYGTDRSVQNVFRVAAERLGAHVECGEAEGANRWLEGGRPTRVACVIDLETCDMEHLTTFLDHLIDPDSADEPLPFPLVLVATREIARGETPVEAHPSAESKPRRVQRWVRQLTAKGAILAPLPVTVAHVTTILDGLRTRDNDAPWYRIHVAS